MSGSSQQDIDVEAHQKELSDQVADGGGCSEA